MPKGVASEARPVHYGPDGLILESGDKMNADSSMGRSNKNTSDRPWNPGDMPAQSKGSTNPLMSPTGQSPMAAGDGHAPIQVGPGKKLPKPKGYGY